MTVVCSRYTECHEYVKRITVRFSMLQFITAGLAWFEAAALLSPQASSTDSVDFGAVSRRVTWVDF